MHQHQLFAFGHARTKLLHRHTAGDATATLGTGAGTGCLCASIGGGGGGGRLFALVSHQPTNAACTAGAFAGGTVRDSRGGVFVVQRLHHFAHQPVALAVATGLDVQWFGRHSHSGAAALRPLPPALERDERCSQRCHKRPIPHGLSVAGIEVL